MTNDISRYKSGTAGEAISLLHERLALLGFSVPPAERSADRFGPGTTTAVRKFQVAHGLSASGVVDEITARGLGLGGYPDAITGIVCTPDGGPLDDVVVRLVQRATGEDRVLAETRSTDSGRFTLPWPAGISGGLFVVAKDTEQSLAWQDVDAGEPAWVRLSVGGAYRGTPQFTRVAAALAPALPGGAFHGLAGAGRAADMASLGAAAGVPAQELSRYALAHRLAERTQLEASVWFALLGHQAPQEMLASQDLAAGDAPTLENDQVDPIIEWMTRLPPGAARAALLSAVSANTVGMLDVDAAAAALHTLQLDELAARPLVWDPARAISDRHECCTRPAEPTEPLSSADGDVDEAATRGAAVSQSVRRPLQVDGASLDDVLATVLNDPAVRRRVVEALAGDDGRARISSVIGDIPELSPEQCGDVRFALEAAVLLANHLPLVQRVQALRTAGKIRDLGDLARLDAGDWERLLRDADPDAARIALSSHAGLAKASGDQRISYLAGVLARRLEASHPTAALAGRLAKDPVALPLPGAAAVQRLLDAVPQLCILHSHIDRVIQDAAPNLAGGDDGTQAVDDLKVLQRSYRLARRFEDVRAMLVAGHRSAHSVCVAGREQFVTQMTEAGATADAAREIFVRAEQVHATALTLMATFHRSLDGAAPAAVAAPVDRGVLSSTVTAFPTVQSLFNTGDYCACAECRSIHGPAAYFVDLLEFLKHRAVTGGTAQRVLFARRPDLAQIQLSCANTTGILPYVDLVCEILEDAVGAAPTRDDLARRQTSGTAEELRANPVFVRDSAYNTLRTATFPLAAPFDLFTAEVRAYLLQLGVPLHELMTALGAPATDSTPPAPSPSIIAGERLGLHPAALSLVADAAPAEPWSLWNLSANTTVPDPSGPKIVTWLEILASVPALLERAQISHRELIQLLETRFINPRGDVQIIQTGTDGFATCDTRQQSVQGWTDDGLTRLNRFVRLWRRLGCTIWDLDKVLCAQGVGNGTLDSEAIAQLGRLDAIATRLRLPWDELLTLWGDVDHVDYVNVLDPDEPKMPSVYRRRFRNPSVAQATPVFLENPDELRGTLDAADTVAGIAAALDLSAEEIRRIRAAAALSSTTAPLTLANLSSITRHAVLARALGMSIDELVAAMAVTGVNPLTGTLTLTATLAFLAGLDQIQQSGFTLAELRYLLRHDAGIDSGIAPIETAITTWLEELRRALVRLGAAGPEAAAELVVQRLSVALAIDPSLTRAVVQKTLPDARGPIAALFTAPELTARDGSGTFTTATARSAFPEIYDAYTALDKMRIVLGRWRVNTSDARWLLQHATQAGWMALHSFPANAAAVNSSTVTLSALDTLRQNVVVQQTLASPSGVRLFDFVLAPGLPPGGTGSSTFPQGISNVAQLGGWRDVDLTALASRMGWTRSAQLVANANVARIRDLMGWSRRLGADMQTTLAFVPTGTPLGGGEARKARQLAKSRVGDDQWLNVSGAIQDRLREQKRAALVAWLLAHPNPQRNQAWSTVEDLYGFYLIDPEMSPVATTTRIKQATASVQLFVQRCLLQLESSVTVNVETDSVWTQWEWMKRFRLWEANRKIFLYPENWFDPAQRHDASPYFAELVNQLQQADLTDDLAQDALRAYVHKLVDVAHLEVCGLWQQSITSERSILHVIARSRKTPYVYSYRRRETTGAWSPWLPLDPGVETSYIMPVIWNKRLFVLWPEFTEKPHAANPEKELTAPPPTGHETARPTQKYWELSLTWMERRGDIWLPKRQSQRKLLFPGSLAKREMVLRTGISGRNLAVEIYKPTVPSRAGEFVRAQWLLSSPEDEPHVACRELSQELKDLEEARYIGDVVASGVSGEGMPSQPKLSGDALPWHFNAFGGDTPNASGTLAMLQDSSTGVHEREALVAITRPRVISTRFGEGKQFSSPFFVSDPARTFFALDISWTFQTFYHPFAETFAQQLAAGGVPALYDRAVQIQPDTVRGSGTFSFSDTYKSTQFVGTPLPIETIDYTATGPYAIYNWELFLHIPLLVAKRLADNQRFDQALRWLHYIFNPTVVSSGEVPQRYWTPRVFRDLTSTDYTAQQIERLLAAVNGSAPELEARIAEWRANPFDPNLIAAARPVAYQKAVVMQYISTLIAWGDQLFRGDTIESINEATQLYLLASQLLGPRPQNLRAIQPRNDQSYAALSDKFDEFSNAVVRIENLVSVTPPGVAPGSAPPPLLSTFYFCIPPNDQMLGYWDLVADRLFKIRHGLNLQGVARPLALYEPPIDPGLLVRAAAAGIDLATVLADTSGDRMCYRFASVWQTAHDLCQDVRGLGSAILAAIERRDGEELARIRATQEIGVLNAVRQVKAKQVDEAMAARTALQSSREMAHERRNYYASRVFMNAAERQAETLVHDAIDLETNAIYLDVAASAFAMLPMWNAGANGWGGTPIVSALLGGENLSRMSSTAASVLRGYANIKSQRSGLSSTLASYQRRAEDWALQERLAGMEIEQIDKQLVAADLRIAIARHELEVQERQIADAKVNAELLHTKFSNLELYDWMVSQLSSTYFHAYELAYDLARRACKAHAFELGVPDPGYIQFGYWDNLHRGLVAGDKLLLDLRRLQVEHLNQNRRDLELTKHISLAQLDPIALIRLRQTGTCFIDVPEKLFDLDQPGHFRRRLKSVSISLPAVVGPYEGIHATLTLQSHQTRMVAEGGTQYRHNVDDQGLPVQDNRFVDSTGGTEAVALSTGREDSGMFEVNFHDERYLPFEGLGAISHWKLDLPRDCNRFDVATLSDVVLHLRYTARNGGETLRGAAQDAVIAALPRAGTQLLSARTEFPDMWAQLWAPVADGQRLDLPLAERHLPPLASTQQYKIKSVTAILLFQSEQTYTDYQNSAPEERLKLHLGRSTTDDSPPIFAPDGNLGGVPSASLAVTGSIAPLSLNFLESEIAAATLLDQVETGANGTTHHRLNRALIDDVLLLVSYDIIARGSTGGGGGTGGGGSSGGGGSGGLSSVTRDATNSNYYPTNAIEWTAVMAAAALTTGNPASVWNLQEASGNAIDSIGGVTLTPANWTTWRAPVPGATRVCMRATDGQSNGKLFNTTTAPSPAQTSTMLVMYLDLPPAPSAIRLVAIAGDSCALRYTTTAKFQLQAGNITTFAQTAAGPRWVVLQCNNTARTVKAYTNQEKVVGTYAQPTSGPFLVLGGNNGAPAAVGYAYAAQFTGAAAELTDAQVKTLLQTLGATVSWT